jgi:hypothetical protein
LVIRRALSAALLLGASLCQAAESAPTVQESVKAAFLYKFTGYVEWPPEAFADRESPLVIGVVGARAIAAELERAAAGRKIGDRAIRVQRVPRADGRCQDCQMLFIGRDVEPEKAAEFLESARGNPVLVVTDTDAGQPRGSVIHFVVAENRVRFDISREAAEQNRLRLASPLLSVARQVRGRTP